MVNDKTQELWTDFPQIGGQINRRHWSASLGWARVAERPGELVIGIGTEDQSNGSASVVPAMQT